MNNRKDYLKEAAEFIKAQGIPVIAVHYESDEYDAEIQLTDLIHIQVISPMEFCLNEWLAAEEAMKSSPVVDLSQIVTLAKEALRGGTGRNS